MKFKFLKSGLLLLAALALTDCTKEMDDPALQTDPLQQSGIPFEISTSVETKTINDGLHTKWADQDELTVFYAPAGEQKVFSSNRRFQRLTSSTNGFSGTLDTNTDPLAEQNDWYAFYPFNSYMDAPDTQKGYFVIGSYYNDVQVQDGPMNTAGLAGEKCPLWGRRYGIPKDDTPNVPLTPTFTVIRVKVSNRTMVPVDINDVMVAASGKNLVGQFYANLSSEKGMKLIPRTNHVSDQARLSVTNARLGRGEYGEFYLVCAPFTLDVDDILRVKVNNCVKEKIITRTNVFEAGEITEISFGYNAVAGEHVIPWVEDFSASDVLSKYPDSTEGTKWMKSDHYADGAAPEIMIGKTKNGVSNSFVASISLHGIVAGETLSLSFKSNYPERITLSSTTAGVTFRKINDSFYEVVMGTIPADGKLKLAFENKTSDNVRLDDIQLTKHLPAAHIFFDQTEIRVQQGETKVTEPTLGGIPVPVRYSSSDNKIASVDPVTGTVTLNKVMGKAVITARSEATLSYAPGEASYSIYVDPVPVQAPQGSRTYVVLFQDDNYKKFALSALPAEKKNHLAAIEQTDINMPNGVYTTKDKSILWDLNHMAADITTLENEGKLIGYENASIGLTESFYSAAQFMLSSPQHGLYNLSFVQEDERVVLTFHKGVGFALVPGASSDINVELVPAQYDTKETLAAPQFDAVPTADHTGLVITWEIVAGATEYLVYVDETLIGTYTDQGTAQCDGLEFGVHKVKVVARSADRYDGVAEKDVYLSNPSGLSPVSYQFVFEKENRFDSNMQTKEFGAGYNWTLNTDAGYFGFNGDKGMQIGSNKKMATSIKMTSTSFAGPITTVRVNTSGASDIKGNFQVKISGQPCGTAVTLTSTPTTYTFDCGGKTGELLLEWSNTSPKAIYVKSIEVDYKK